MPKNVFALLCMALLAVVSCKDEKREKVEEANVVKAEDLEPIEVKEFGYNLNQYLVVRDTVKAGDSFGEILQRNNLDYPQIYNIVEGAKDSFNIASLQVGKPYTLLCTKEDSLQVPKCFIYQPNSIDYVVVDFADSTLVKKGKKEVKLVEREATGVINSSLYQTLQEQGLSPIVAYKMSDIYAWTVDFFRIQKGDRFKVIYTEKYIDDSIYAGVDKIKAAYFEHKGEPFYSFRFETDSTKHIVDYFDDKAKNLRRAFLKAPVQFSRISSRYNLNRRIAYYGNKVRPHKGTDFAAPIGTPILSTANGTVVESARRGGNGNYVKVKHNSTYSTQYLHMSKRKVRVGDYVKQGDVIGWIGMTGNTSGPHVCYRFWKNGRQVDPFRQDLPKAEPIGDSLKVKYLAHIEPFKKRLDSLVFPSEETTNEEEFLTELNQKNATSSSKSN
ncbi:peptidoglycan DD-metalloendopeptidase family protein [Galbibacter mesophilus]|uniref:peptidoglycan DD-metalloendopeptidase family protein n=1 Tax=Galbibacter mesophilus TaxID=379069 RepID=UPI0019203700|nr:peptidoglycan DD-metalloendopeptidase family protein [Galbibacter mesophilus]MCM5662053.1 peptidoglycan DD-metalloendopeptidase family protein [Galbibacter mesophilus]